MSKSAERIQGIFALLALMAVLGVCGFADNARAAAAPSARILVLPFQVHADSAQPRMEADFPEMLGKRIGAAGAAVVPHEQMMRLLKSRKVSTLDVATVRSLASAAGATHAVYGSVNQTGGSLSVDARLVAASAGQAPSSPTQEKCLI